MKSRRVQSISEALRKKIHGHLKHHLMRQLLYICSSLLLMTIELGVFLYFFLFSGKTLIPAFCLACFITTLFIFFVMRLYFLTRKPEYFEQLIADYLARAKQLCKSDSIIDEQAYLASSATLLALDLQNQEYTLLSDRFKWVSKYPVLQKLSCFCFWKDYFLFRECLLQKSIEAYLKVVQTVPTNLGAHVDLADAYVALSGLYADPRKYPEFDANYWVPPGRYDESVQEKFFATAQRATEEFKILNEYAPGNAWVHAQLAYSYHDLQMPQEEIQEYETILSLKPDDIETMTKLGILYFQQGMNAKGLRIYEELKKRSPKKSQRLIKFYGLEFKTFNSALDG